MARKKPVQPLPDIRSLLKGTIGDIEAIARSKVARQELLKTLRLADHLLSTRLTALAGKRGGTTRFSAASAEAYRQHALLATEYVQKRLSGLTAAQATKAIGTSMARTVTLMESLEKRFTGVAMPIPLRAAAEMRAAGAKAKGVWLRDFPSSVSRYGTKMIGEFERVMNVGLIAGRSHDEMVAALTAHGGPDGLFQKHKYWAERIVRTETLRAYNGARQVGFEEMHKTQPDLQKKIIAILDKRTAPDSIAVNGQIRPINGLFMDGAGRQYLYPPARPNDRETTIPWRTLWQDETDHLDEFEKAVLGELSPEEEQALIDRIQGKGKKAKPPKEKKPRAPRPKKAKPAPEATPPMEAPIPPPKVTNHERLTQMYVDDTWWKPDGANVQAYAGGKLKGAAIWYRGQWRADWYQGVNIQFGQRYYDTVEEAMDELRGMLTVEARAAAHLTADSGSFDDLQKALASGDGAETRKHVRAVLRDAGVVPRDPLRDMSTSMKTDGSVSPGAEATHHWDGTVGIKPGVLPKYAVDKDPAGGFDVVIHEELHGCTPFKTPWFYFEHGAAIEECTVEMAARKVSADLFAKRGLYPAGKIPVFGAYDSTINQLKTIISQETGLGGAQAWELIADTGVKMRGPGALDVIGGAPLETPNDIVDLFLGHLDVKEDAKPSLRRRIIAELRL